MSYTRFIFVTVPYFSIIYLKLASVSGRSVLMFSTIIVKSEGVLLSSSTFDSIYL